MRFLVGTRGSRLALRQTEIFIELFRRQFPEAEMNVVIIKTKGDMFLRARPSDIPQRGLFVREIEEKLIRGEIDFAVHSLKDVPLEIPHGLSLSAFPRRDDPSDVIVGMTSSDISRGVGLGRRVRVGTSSVRREFLMRERFGDIDIVPIRGNLETRVGKVRKGECDCAVVALSGIIRLGDELVRELPFEVLDPEVFPYSPGQGVIAVETKIGTLAHELAGLVDDPKVRFIAEIERGILRRLGGGCSVPLAVFSKLDDKCLRVGFRLLGTSLGFRGTFDLDPGKLPDPRIILEKLFEDLKNI